MKHYKLPDWWVYGQKILTGDLDRIECGANATNILTPGQSDPPDMKVHVSGGYVYFDELAHYFTAADSPTFVAPTVHPRWDVLYLDNDGSLKILQGEEVASSPKPPFESGWIPIAYIYNRISEIKLIDNYDDDTTNGLIIDTRKFLTSADMRKSVYDADNNGIVDNSDSLGGITATRHLLTDGTRKLTGHLDFDGHRAINLLDPISDQDAVTIHYFESIGVMLKSIYDSGDDGRVNDSDKLAGLLAAEYLRRNGSVALTGDLDMNGHDAVNIGRLKFPNLTLKPEAPLLLALMNEACTIYEDLKLAVLQIVSGIEMNGCRITELPEPISNDEPATKVYVDTKPFRLEKSDKVAGEILVFGNIVYLESDNRWYETDISNYNKTAGLLAMVLSSSVGIDQIPLVLMFGIHTDISWSYTPGAILYLGATAGSFSEVRPSGPSQKIRKIGNAYGTDTVFFNPDSTVLEVL